MKTLFNILSWAAAAFLGTASGLILFTSLAVVQVSGSVMLPGLEPGDRVLVLTDSLVTGAPEVEPGDLVVLEAPCYTAGGEGNQLVRRVTGTRGSWLRLNCDVKTVQDQEIHVKKEEILGRVLLRIPRLEIF